MRLSAEFIYMLRAGPINRAVHPFSTSFLMIYFSGLQTDQHSPARTATSQI